MSTETFDVAVVGAGPAGATLATILAAQERRVVLLDRAKLPHTASSLGWLNVRVASLLTELGMQAKPAFVRPFRNVTFHDAEFSKSTEPNFDDAAGSLVDRLAFANSLVTAASKAGVSVIAGSAVADVRLKEDVVILELADGGRVESRLLVLASGRGSDLLDRAGFTREGRDAVIWTAQVETVLGPRAAGAAPQVDIVFGLDKIGSFGLCCVAKERMSVCINWMGERADALPELVHLSNAAYTHEVVPTDLSGEARSAPLVRSPAGVALDMDTHVGKHTLVIGDAGGFVSAASNEGIYPAMWSGQIAAEVIAAALQSPRSQDELMAFDSKWRMQMADYLRSPNTDSQFLIPLIFSNQPMADRMGAAFFSGENI